MATHIQTKTAGPSTAGARLSLERRRRGEVARGKRLGCLRHALAVRRAGSIRA